MRQKNPFIAFRASEFCSESKWTEKATAGEGCGGAGSVGHSGVGGRVWAGGTSAGSGVFLLCREQTPKTKSHAFTLDQRLRRDISALTVLSADRTKTTVTPRYR